MGRPICPSNMSEEGKARWKILIPQIDEMGILAKIDYGELVQYCSIWGEWDKAYKWLQEHGQVYQIRAEPTKKQKEEGKQGDIKSVQQWPQVSIYRNLGERLSRIGKEFGLTHPSRAGMTVGSKGKEKEEKDKSRFFSAG